MQTSIHPCMCAPGLAKYISYIVLPVIISTHLRINLGTDQSVSACQLQHLKQNMAWHTTHCIVYACTEQLRWQYTVYQTRGNFWGMKISQISRKISVLRKYVCECASICKLKYMVLWNHFQAFIKYKLWKSFDLFVFHKIFTPQKFPQKAA